MTELHYKLTQIPTPVSLEPSDIHCVIFCNSTEILPSSP